MSDDANMQSGTSTNQTRSGSTVADAQELLRTMPLNELVAWYRSKGRFCDPRLRRTALRRLGRETVSAAGVMAMLPRRPKLKADLENFLKGLDVHRLGCIGSANRHFDGPRWNRSEVNVAIENSPAGLLFRAQREFRGQLPEELHGQMMMESFRNDTRDEYQKTCVQEYCWWCDKP